VNAPHTSADTPVMRQFLDIKKGYPDAILMFRMGDFYEMFFEDATTVGPVLDIAVTSRDKGVECPVPMAGVPYHAIGGYLRTLVERGFKVAICEQMETPEQAKLRKGPKIVRREVVRVVTPGVLVDEEHLRSEEPNYLVAVVAEAGEGDARAFGVAALDVSCGEFVALRCADAAGLRAALSRLGPREILSEPGLQAWLREALGPACPRLEARDPGLLAAALVARVHHLREESGGEPLRAFEAQAAALALGYAEETQPGHTLLIHRLRRYEQSERMILDETSLRNLEVFRTLRDGKREGSLLWALDATRTAMGRAAAARLDRGAAARARGDPRAARRDRGAGERAAAARRPAGPAAPGPGHRPAGRAGPPRDGEPARAGGAARLARGAAGGPCIINGAGESAAARRDRCVFGGSRRCWICRRGRGAGWT
jgi:DNA mismatch repair protein MutS